MKILFLAHRVPFPPDRGDRIRAFHALRYLAERAEVDLACTADEPTGGEQLSQLQAICRRVAIAPLGRMRMPSIARSLLTGRSASEGAFSSNSLRRTLQKWNRDETYDAVFVHCSSMTPYLDQIDISRDRVVVDLVDVDSRKWSEYAAESRGPRRMLYALEARRVHDLERRAAARSARLLLTTSLEARLAAEACPGATVSVLANGVDLDYFGAVPDSALSRTAPNDAPTFVFTGVLDYLPNVRGICDFAAAIWPEVRREFPAARFRIVGRKPVAAVRDLANRPGIELHADVPDVRPHLAQATVVVAPLRIARGVQNKVLEGMAARRAVVATPQAAAGIDAVAGEHLLVADSPAEWTAALSLLSRSVSTRSTIAAAGRRFVERNHVWHDQLRRLDAWLGISATSPSDVAPLLVR